MERFTKMWRSTHGDILKGMEPWDLPEDLFTAFLSGYAVLWTPENVRESLQAAH